jgi:hypothetical protein
MRPVVGATSAPIMLRMMDLPHPEGPTRATNSWSMTSKDTADTAGTSRAPWPKVLARSRMEMRTRAEGVNAAWSAAGDPGPSYRYLAWAFFTKPMSTAFAYGMGFSTASGIYTLSPRA